MSHRCLRTLLTGLILVTALRSVAAASIEVAPVSHDLAPGQTAISMTVSNRSDAETTLQVRGFAWTQEDGVDRLVATGELLVAPAIFSVAPGRSQVLRMRVPPAPAGHEMSYRLLIDELPALAVGGEVRMALRLSVPVFAHGAAPAAARLTARLDADHRGLTLVNRGATRTRVHALAVIVPGGERHAAIPAGGPYLLAGAQRAWSLPAAAHRSPLDGTPTLMALTDTGHVEVPLDAAP